MSMHVPGEKNNTRTLSNILTFNVINFIPPNITAFRVPKSKFKNDSQNVDHTRPRSPKTSYFLIGYRCLVNVLRVHNINVISKQVMSFDFINYGSILYEWPINQS